MIEFNHSQFAQTPEKHMQQFTLQWLDFVMATEITDFERIKQQCNALSQFGQNEQKAFWVLNDRLKKPLEKLMRDSEGGGKVSQLLNKLQESVLKIKPPKPSFFGNLLNRFKLLFSLKESAWELWLETYPIHKQKILDITEQLESQKRQLKRDNALLITDKNELNKQMQMLENNFDMLSFLEKKANHEVIHNQEFSSDAKQLLVNELLPVMQERIIELQQQLLIARQSVMTMDLFIQQNETLLKGTDHALNTIIKAIDVTTSIFMLKQLGQSNVKSTAATEDGFTHNNVTVNSQKLKLARKIIDKALTEMDGVETNQKNVSKPSD